LPVLGIFHKGKGCLTRVVFPTSDRSSDPEEEEEKLKGSSKEITGFQKAPNKYQKEGHPQNKPCTGSVSPLFRKQRMYFR
jgi:hypothetical protein